MRGASLLLLRGWVKVKGALLWIMGLLKYDQHLKRIKIWWFCMESFISPLQISFFFFFKTKKDQLLKKFPITRVYFRCFMHLPWPFFSPPSGPRRSRSPALWVYLTPVLQGSLRHGGGVSWTFAFLSQRTVQLQHLYVKGSVIHGWVRKRGGGVWCCEEHLM